MSRGSTDRRGAPPSHGPRDVRPPDRARTVPPSEPARDTVARPLGRAAEAARLHEARMDSNATWRLAHPTVPEQQTMGLLAELGERYRADFQREHKITAADGSYVTHVDFAWPADRLVLQMYGEVHYGAYFNRDGQRSADDARMVQRVESAGWEVLVVRDDELTRERWARTVDRVGAWLEEQRGQW